MKKTNILFKKREIKLLFYINNNSDNLLLEYIFEEDLKNHLLYDEFELISVGKERGDYDIIRCRKKDDPIGIYDLYLGYWNDGIIYEG